MIILFYIKRDSGVSKRIGQNRTAGENRSFSGREFTWSGRRDLNPRHPAWKAGVLPLNYSRLINYRKDTSQTGRPRVNYKDATDSSSDLYNISQKICPI